MCIRDRSDSIDGLTTYTYDADDRLILETFSTGTRSFNYDGNGNQISISGPEGTSQYRYSGENRLLAADVDGDGTEDVVYQYDYLGNRVSRTEDGQTTHFLVDTNRELSQVLVEYSAAGDISASYTFADELISQLRSGETSYYHVDGLGSTSVLTDSSGNVVNRYQYDAFGVIVDQSETVENEFLFTGQRRDPTTGLDYLRERNYSSLTGRFTSVDPFAGALNSPITLNDYVYANSNPTTFVDPTGQFSIAENITVSATLIDIQKSFVAAGFTGLKRVGRIADQLLVPGLEMQNAGLELISSDSVRGLDLLALGGELRAAGFEAVRFAIGNIYTDTVKSLAKITLEFGPVKVGVNLLTKDIEASAFGVQGKVPSTSAEDKLLNEYLRSVQELLNAEQIAEYITGRDVDGYEAAAARTSLAVNRLITGLTDQRFLINE